MPKYVGIRYIAEHMGITMNQANHMRSRGIFSFSLKFPRKRNFLWKKETIDRWIAKNRERVLEKHTKEGK